MSSAPHAQALSRAFARPVADHFGGSTAMVDAEAARADPAQPRGGPR